MLTLVRACRSATLATVTPTGRARLVPICFVLSGDANSVYSPLDEKPKRDPEPRALARVRDIEARPDITLLFERWSEEWSDLAWVRAYGHARLVEPNEDRATHLAVVRSLRTKYPQYATHRLESLPMLRMAITKVTVWSAGGSL